MEYILLFGLLPLGAEVVYAERKQQTYMKFFSITKLGSLNKLFLLATKNSLAPPLATTNVAFTCLNKCEQVCMLFGVKFDYLMSRYTH